MWVKIEANVKRVSLLMKVHISKLLLRI